MKPLLAPWRTQWLTDGQGAERKTAECSVKWDSLPIATLPKTPGDHGRRDRKPQSESAVVDGYKGNIPFWAQPGKLHTQIHSGCHSTANAYPDHIPTWRWGAECETPLVAMELLAAGSCKRQGSWGVSHAPEEDHTSTYNLGNTGGS